MSQGFNKVILEGRVGRDPDIRASTSKNKSANFSLAISKSWKDRQTGEKRDKTTWVPCIVWGTLADVAERYVKKGSLLLIEGEWENNHYDDKQGVKHYRERVNVSNFVFLSGGKRDDDQGQYQPRESNYGRQNENLPGQYGQDAEFEEDFPLDFSELGGEDSGGGAGEVDVPF